MTVTRQVSPAASATTISSTVNSTTREGDPAETYSFTIVNQSGVSQSYAIFCKEPAVHPPAHGLVSHAVLVAHGVASGSGTAFLALPRTELYALCGTNYKDGSVQVRVLDRRQVSLGIGSSDTLRHGTTCVTQVTSATPSFDLWGGPADDRGEVGAFCIETGADFTYEQAAAKNFILGLGLSSSGHELVGLYASFTPVPRTTYQIWPSKTFYVVPERTEVNAPRAATDLRTAYEIDFTMRLPHVQLVHNESNVIEIVDRDPTPGSATPSKL
ncbi:hypothetical protein HFD88_003941 [Aspergillus terreus]|nr:hypothetical protein HFD88_003941 [Aspergillus terreus]